MKVRKRIISLVIVITVAVVLMVNKVYVEEFLKDDTDNIKVLDYKAPEVINERGYEISKYDDLIIKEWLDKNRVIVLKDKELNDVGANAYISVYDLNTRTYTDYENTRVFKYSDILSSMSISPNRRYVFYTEVQSVSDFESKEDKEAFKTGKISLFKYNILDLTTGEIINDFDKGKGDCAISYRWINNDYLFSKGDLEWKVINKQGDIIKEGKIDCNDGSIDKIRMLDVGEIKVSDNEVDGDFYYEKYKSKGRDGLITEICSMNIKNNEERKIARYDGYQKIKKQGNLFDILDVIRNDSNEVSASSIDLMDSEGNIVHNYEVKDITLDEVQISDNGEKCAFVEYNKIVLDGSLKIMDIKSGEIKEITKIKSLINNVDYMEIEEGKSYLSYNMVWDKTGTALAFNYSYTRNVDERKNKNTYTIMFDK